jgi:hypothetical protein
MDPANEQLQLLLDLESRHDALLAQLDDLERRVAEALKESQALLKPLAAAAPAPLASPAVEEVPRAPLRRAA